MGTEKAADVLGVSRMRVRQLVAQRDLPARRASGVLLLDAIMVHRRAAAEASARRPISTVQAWRIADVIESHVRPTASADGTNARLGRIRGRIRELSSEPSVGALAWWLRRRSAATLRLSANPSAVSRMSTDARFVPSGPQAARSLGAELVPDGSIETYVDREDLADVTAEHALLDAGASSNVTLRRVEGLTGAVVRSADAGAPALRIASALLIATDLADHGDVGPHRSRRICGPASGRSSSTSPDEDRAAHPHGLGPETRNGPSYSSECARV